MKNYEIPKRILRVDKTSKFLRSTKRLTEILKISTERTQKGHEKEIFSCGQNNKIMRSQYKNLKWTKRLNFSDSQKELTEFTKTIIKLMKENEQGPLLLDKMINYIIHQTNNEFSLYD